METKVCRYLTAEEAEEAREDCPIDFGFGLSRQDLIYLGLAAYAAVNRTDVQNWLRGNTYAPFSLLAIPFLVDFLGGDDDHKLIGLDLCLDMEDILVLGGLGYAAARFS